MPLRRIFSEHGLREGRTVPLTGEAANHVSRVLRLRVGDTLVLFDGSGRDFDGEITALGRDAASVRVGAGREVTAESPADITLLQGICRGPRMDTVLQKSTELGVRRIQPVLTERSVVRLDAAQAARKQEHWQRVAISACEQCGRSLVPQVATPQTLDEALAGVGASTLKLLLDPHADATLGAIVRRDTAVALLVGPEGGFSEAERRLASDRGFCGVRLGPRILRTETAPLAALAVLQFLAGDLG